MTSNSNKYGKNRNLWRKVYNYRRKKPVVRQYVDANTAVSFSYDLQTVMRFRDFYYIGTTKTGSAYHPITSSLAQYDEGLITFNNTDQATGTFSFTFAATPDAVVLTVDPATAGDSSENIIPFGLSFSTTGLTVGLSAPFKGNIRYRAVYSSTGYPAQATSPLVPGSGTFTLSAGGVAIANATAYTASYSALSGVPTLFYKTSWGTVDANLADVYLSKETSSATTVTGEISAPYSNQIYFIAVQ